MLGDTSTLAWSYIGYTFSADPADWLYMNDLPNLLFSLVLEVKVDHWNVY